MHVTFNKQDESFNIEEMSRLEFLKIRFFLKLSLLWHSQNKEHYLYSEENESLCEDFSIELEKCYIKTIENKEVL